MKCKYFILTGRCKHCPALQEKKGEDMECPKPNELCFKVHEWWKDNRGDNMIEFFDKLEVKK
jgi:hypothetical protein